MDTSIFCETQSENTTKHVCICQSGWGVVLGINSLEHVPHLQCGHLFPINSLKNIKVIWGEPYFKLLTAKKTRTSNRSTKWSKTQTRPTAVPSHWKWTSLATNRARATRMSPSKHFLFCPFSPKIKIVVQKSEGFLTPPPFLAFEQKRIGKILKRVWVVMRKTSSCAVLIFTWMGSIQ